MERRRKRRATPFFLWSAAGLEPFQPNSNWSDEMHTVTTISSLNRIIAPWFQTVVLITCIALVCASCAPREARNAAAFSPDEVPVFDDDLEGQAARARERAAACQKEIDRLETDITIGLVDQMASAMKSRQHSNPRVREQAAKDFENINTTLAVQSARQSQLVAERDGWIRVLERIKAKKDKQGGSGGGGGC
jgi:hypothetical protein